MIDSWNPEPLISASSKMKSYLFLDQYNFYTPFVFITMITLQAVKVSNIDVSQPFDEQAECTDGWM